MRGGAQSHLMEANDGHYYVVKFSNNPQHRRILVNEWISCVLLRYLQVHVPETGIINILASAISEMPDLGIVRGSKREPPEPGPHFGSRLSVNPDRVAIYDFLPDALLLERLRTAGISLGFWCSINGCATLIRGSRFSSGPRQKPGRR